MSKLDNRNKDLLELCRKQEKEIKELTLKLAKMEGDNKTSAPSCGQLEGMKRLTEKRTVQPSCDINGELESKKYIYIKVKGLAEKKLFELEDIEEKLGIDLITLFKALKNGFYVSNDKYNTDKCLGALAYNFNCSELEEEKRWSILGFAYGYEAAEWKFPEDYGKTWALTKEELE